MTEQEELQKAIKICGLRPLARALGIPNETLHSAAHRPIKEGVKSKSKLYNDPFIAIIVQKLTNNKVKAKNICYNSSILNNHFHEIEKIIENSWKK